MTQPTPETTPERAPVDNIPAQGNIGTMLKFRCGAALATSQDAFEENARYELPDDGVIILADVPRRQRTYDLCERAMAQNVGNFRSVPEELRNEAMSRTAVAANQTLVSAVPDNEPSGFLRTAMLIELKLLSFDLVPRSSYSDLVLEAAAKNNIDDIRYRVDRATYAALVQKLGLQDKASLPPDDIGVSIMAQIDELMELSASVVAYQEGYGGSQDPTPDRDQSKLELIASIRKLMAEKDDLQYRLASIEAGIEEGSTMPTESDR